MAYFVYILECSNQSYYTGYTTDVMRRYEEHRKGSAKCKYTRSFPPVDIIACWKISTDLSLALKTERLIKKLKKTDKEFLINNPKLLDDILIDNQCDVLELKKIIYCAYR